MLKKEENKKSASATTERNDTWNGKEKARIHKLMNADPNTSPASS